MERRYELLNKLYHAIISEQAGDPIPDHVLKQDPEFYETRNAVRQISAKICSVSKQNKYETMMAISKLFTAGLVDFDRNADGEWKMKPVKDIDENILQEFNEKLQR